MRLTTEFVVGALIRRAQTAGAYATVARKGDATAGALFVLVIGQAGRCALYGPAPAYALDETTLPSEAALTGNRVFVAMPLDPATEETARDAFEREARLDPDFWVVEIEDRAMRSFLPVVDLDSKA